MDKRRLVVFGTCLAMCLAVGSSAAAESIPAGDFVYAPGHYLEGQPVETGFDIFGVNYQAKVANPSSHGSMAMGFYGFPPYGGDDQAYLERLVAEQIHGVTTIEEAMALLAINSEWYKRCWPVVFWWNEPWRSSSLDLNDDGVLDWHPFSPAGAASGPYDPAWPAFRGSGAACEGIWSNLWTMDPNVPGLGTMDCVMAAVPLDAQLVALPHPVWQFTHKWCEPDGSEIGYTWFNPLMPGMDYCWAAVRQRCWCGDTIVFDYQSPSEWGKLKVRGH
jgi:hypothetical protein